MATSKLTDRTELTVQPANDDLVHVVDVDDTTGSADGTSKKITVQNLLLGAGGSSTTITVRNNTGSTILKGKAVYITGVVSSTPTIALADNSAASTTPAIGLTAGDIPNNTDGNLLTFGELTNVDTSAFSASDTLYLGTSGDLTTTKPTGTALIQNIGSVLKVSASTGSILVEGAGRTNDVPNIPNGQAWIGNASGVATPTTLADVATGGEITDLTDTPASLGLASQVLQVNAGATALEWVDRVRQIGQLGDVGIVSPVDRQVLIYNATGSNWRNGNLALAEASDVDPTAPNNGDVLTYDTGTSRWRPQAPSGGANNMMKNWAYFDNIVRDVYVPMTNESEGTTIQRYNRFVCPVDMSVTTVVIYPSVNLSGGTGGSFQVGREFPASTFSLLETQTFSSVSAGTPITLTFTSNSMTAGNVYLFRITNGFASYYGNMVGTILFEI